MYREEEEEEEKNERKIFRGRNEAAICQLIPCLEISTDGECTRTRLI